MIAPARAPLAGSRPRARGMWRRPMVAWVLTASVISLFVAFGVMYLSPITPAPISRSAGGATTALFVLPFMSFAVMGGLIAARAPGNAVGWLLLAGTMMLISGALTSLIGANLEYAHNAAGPWVTLGGIFWVSGPSPSTLCFVTALLLFPDSHLPSRRWRWLWYAGAAFTVLNVLASVTDPAPGVLGIGYSATQGVDTRSPLGIAGAHPVVSLLQVVLTFAGDVVGPATLVSVFLRRRGADDERRHQIKWFASGAAVTVTVITVTNTLPGPVNAGAVYAALFIAVIVLGVSAMPAGAAVAILKYRLYDIDVIISRALIYGSLAVFIGAVYVGIAVGIGALAGGGGRPNLGLSILATAIVAVGFQPVRERVQRVANRLVFGRRATPYEALSRFGERVAGSYAADDVLPRMARVLADGAGAEVAGVWLRRGTSLVQAARWPEGGNGTMALHQLDGTDSLPDADRSVAVRHQGDLLGALTITKRRGEAVTPTEVRLMDDLANQAGLVLRNVGLTADLEARIQDLRESRERLVAAQDDERRRLERNLHDGAQRQVLTLKADLVAAERLFVRDPSEACEAMTRLEAAAGEALENLRDLARGIYPPLLADKGLGAALEAQSRKSPVPVLVEADGVGRYVQEVESAVYFCCLEALQNVQKHAGHGARARIGLQADETALRVAVVDDGCGFDTGATVLGVGLTNMRDRVDALGGTLTVESERGRGTTLVVVIRATPRD